MREPKNQMLGTMDSPYAVLKVLLFPFDISKIVVKLEDILHAVSYFWEVPPLPLIEDILHTVSYFWEVLPLPLNEDILHAVS